MKFALVILIAFALIGPSALAAESAASLAKILDQQRETCSDLDAGAFGNLTPRQANAIRKAQAEVINPTNPITISSGISDHS
jgi:hypothetical protein